MSGADPIEVRCPAKVNLFLEVLGRRPDGYHDLSTVFLKVALFDSLFLTPAAEVSLTVEGAALPEGDGNLVHAAAEAFRRAFGVREGVRMRLTKRIPLQAGLGGGSSDAAATLLSLAALFRPEVSPEDLAPIALRLGSDVPFFLDGPCARGEGRGERLTPLPPPAPRYLALFFPPFGLSTAAVYAALEPPRERRDPAPLVAALRASPECDLVPHLFNRLEAAAARVDPRVAGVRADLAAALRPGEAVLLSGSGSAFFAPLPSLSRALEVQRAWSALPAGRALVARTMA